MGAHDSLSEQLLAARSGDEEGLAAIYRQLQPRLIRYLAAREPKLADDLASDVWLAVARGLHAFEGGEIEFRAWLFSIARRRLADVRRTAVRRATDPVAEPALDQAAVADTENEALDALAAEDAAAFIASILPPDQAEVIFLRVLADLDVERVAELLGKRPGTIRVLQHRALRRLSTELAYRPVTK